MLLQLDMEKAYDSKCWEPLNHILDVMGFPEKIINLIIQCISYSKSSIEQMLNAD